MKKRFIYLDFLKAKKEGLFQNREKWFEEYKDITKIEKSTYEDILKGAPLIVNIDGFTVFDKDIEKLISFSDKVYWYHIGNPYDILKWRR